MCIGQASLGIVELNYFIWVKQYGGYVQKQLSLSNDISIWLAQSVSETCFSATLDIFHQEFSCLLFFMQI